MLLRLQIPFFIKKDVKCEYNDTKMLNIISRMHKSNFQANKKPKCEKISIFFHLIENLKTGFLKTAIFIRNIFQILEHW